jgi:hypothetical protein
MGKLAYLKYCMKHILEIADNNDKHINILINTSRDIGREEPLVGRTCKLKSVDVELDRRMVSTLLEPIKCYPGFKFNQLRKLHIG